MGKKKEEILGAFLAVDDKKIVRKIIISQESKACYRGKDIHLKNLYLDKIHGPRIHKTDNPDIFTLTDGTILRRKWVNQY